MSLLKKYLTLKGITTVQISEGTGLKYHCVDKTLKGLRNGRNPRKKIIEYLKAQNLELQYDKIWSSSSSKYLHKLINKEIQANADAARANKIRVLKRRFLGSDSQITARVANI